MNTEATALDLMERRARERAAEMRRAASSAERIHNVPPFVGAARAYACRLREAAALLEQPIVPGGSPDAG